MTINIRKPLNSICFLVLIASLVAVKVKTSVAVPVENFIDGQSVTYAQQRQIYKNAISVTEIIERTNSILDDLKRSHPYLSEYPLRISAIELYLSPQKRCDVAETKLKSIVKPYWFVEILPIEYGSGGGVCLFLDAANGSKLLQQLTE